MAAAHRMASSRMCWEKRENNDYFVSWSFTSFIHLSVTLYSMKKWVGVCGSLEKGTEKDRNGCFGLQR